MTEKEILQVHFKEAGVGRSSLLAECICDIERYLEISEEQLRGIQWVDKEGQLEPMISSIQARNVITNRDILIRNAGRLNTSRDIVQGRANDLVHTPTIRSLLTSFTSSRTASNVSVRINRVDNITEAYLSNGDILQGMSGQESNDFIDFVRQATWDVNSLNRLLESVNTLVDAIRLIVRVQNPLINPDKTRIKNAKRRVLRNWCSLRSVPEGLRDIILDVIPEYNCQEGTIAVARAISLLQLDDVCLSIVLDFVNEFIKLELDVPKKAKDAIATGNPFMFRSLFLSFAEAKSFAVGGKLNSSLETKYGNLFEKVMSRFGGCRGIYNGGIDVAVDFEAYDIKSGPAVMNLSQVNAFSNKKRLILGGLLPGLTSYNVALGYGTRDQLNSFMSRIDDQILPGRESWTKITGDPYSPELVFALSALSARAFGAESIVSAMLGLGRAYDANGEADDNQFTQMFDAAFSPVTLPEDISERIREINTLLR